MPDKLNKFLKSNPMPEGEKVNQWLWHTYLRGSSCASYKVDLSYISSFLSRTTLSSLDLDVFEREESGHHIF